MGAKSNNNRIKINKTILNIIRTTMRNNIELTHIADNKANVLLSLNAFMITFMIPLIIPYLDVVKKFNLVLAIAVLFTTCFVVIYLCVLVLKPSKFFKKQDKLKEGKYISPFFFGNFYHMSLVEFNEYIREAVSDVEMVKDHITEDLHYIGTRLGRKMSLIRLAFSIFLVGLFTAASITIGCLYIYG